MRGKTALEVKPSLWSKKDKYWKEQIGSQQLEKKNEAIVIGHHDYQKNYDRRTDKLLRTKIIKALESSSKNQRLSFHLAKPFVIKISTQ